MEKDFLKLESDAKSVIKNVWDEVSSLSDANRIIPYTDIFTCIDNTTLNGSDSPKTVSEFCRNTSLLSVTGNGIRQHVASVCVYPSFVGIAKKQLASTTIRVASVAGGFPAGQTSQHVKTEEIRYVVEEGADEVDFVINRGRFLDGDLQYVSDEIEAAKSVCGNSVKLKVIIETGELKTMANIYNASMLALRAGADFIKTSTGKIPLGATPEGAFTMLSALCDFMKNSKKNVGFKAAGGISTPEEALFYYLLYKKIISVQNITNQNFRIGTSRLTAQLQNILTF